MKTTRKLFPAIAMLLLAAVMMSTATYAWFSMNTTVTATGMQIEAKSDQTFLLISAKETTAQKIREEFADDGLTSRNAVLPAVTKVYPATVKNDKLPTKDSDLEFYYAVGTAYDDGTAKDGNYTKITDSNIANYVVKYTFYITVAEGALPASDIVVKGITFTGDDAVAAVVTTEYAAKVFKANSGEDDTILSSGLHADDPELAGKITDGDVLAVNVYVYYDGEDATVKSSNAGNLNNATIEITFGVKDATP